MSNKKITFQAGSDVALIKYWGKKNEELRLPENGSIAVNLSGLNTVTTVDVNDSYKQDVVLIEGGDKKEESIRVIKHLDRVRKIAKSSLRARVESKNSFPKGTGLSSSGSGFAALTLAASQAYGLHLSQKELSILARQGSGTACRCVCGGFVEWKDGQTSSSSYSETIFESSYWDLRDVVVVVNEGMKKVSSTQGHTKAQTSFAFEERQRRIGHKTNQLKEFIENKDFAAFGELIEKEALEFHSILLTSEPPLIAWYPGTVEVMKEVQALRDEGIQAYFTINTGFNVHVLTLPEFEDEVQERMRKLSLVKKVLEARIGEGPKKLTKHLF